jgi:hypothetical protein
MSEVNIESVLEYEFESTDLGKCTIEHYLMALARQCWIKEEGFSGKRPFGNSGWKTDIYAALADGGFIKGEKEDGDYFSLDTVRGNEIILECFDYISYILGRKNDLW